MLSQLLKLCRWEVECLGESSVGLAEWEEFAKQPCWRVIAGEIKARDEVLMQNLRYGDDTWSDKEIRARINELEFVLTIPEAMVTELRMRQKPKEESNEQPD
jgi:hypothetical protein